MFLWYLLKKLVRKELYSTFCHPGTSPEKTMMRNSHNHWGSYSSAKGVAANWFKSTWIHHKGAGAHTLAKQGLWIWLGAAESWSQQDQFSDNSGPIQCCWGEMLWVTLDATAMGTIMPAWNITAHHWDPSCKVSASHHSPLCVQLWQVKVGSASSGEAVCWSRKGVLSGDQTK